jgi:hypothetical protein
MRVFIQYDGQNRDWVLQCLFFYGAEKTDVMVNDEIMATSYQFIQTRENIASFIYGNIRIRVTHILYCCSAIRNHDRSTEQVLYLLDTGLVVNPDCYDASDGINGRFQK